MKKSNVLVYGIGIKGMKYPAVINDNILDEYRAWRSFLFRCTETCWGRQETYKGTSCSGNFKYYEFFYEWYHKQDTLLYSGLVGLITGIVPNKFRHV